MSYSKVYISSPNQPVQTTLRQVKTVLVLALTAILLASSIVASDPPPIKIGGFTGLNPSDTVSAYPIVLALSGGGARGLAAVGVLQAFEERNIRVAAIAGTSIGGIVGGLYACGYKADAIKQIIHETDFSSIFQNEPARSSMFFTQRQYRDRHLLSIRFDGLRPQIPQGLTSGQQLASLLARLTVQANYLADGDFGKFLIPFRTITTDIVSGQMVMEEHGSLSEALRATMSFPLAFTGVGRQEQLLMDGGMMVPIPVELAKQMCDSTEFCVAVNTTSPLLPKKDLLSPVDIANQVTTIMVADQLAAQLQHADFVISPCPERVKSLDFEIKDSIMNFGYEAGKAAADIIVSRIRSAEDTSTFVINEVTVSSEDTLLLYDLNKRVVGYPLTRRDLVRALQLLVRRHELFSLDAQITPMPMQLASGELHPLSFGLEVNAVPGLAAASTEVRFNGNVTYADTVLRRVMAIPDGTISSHIIHEGIRRVLKLYRDHDCSLVSVRDLEVYPDSSLIVVDLDEAIVKNIDVNENTRTKDWFVRSYFPLKRGEPYSGAAANRGISDIYGTDLFERVRLDVTRADGGANVAIAVEEKRHTQVRLGWHWDDQYQSEEFAEILDNNVAGMGMQCLAHAQYGIHRQQYYGDAQLNRLFYSYLTAQLRLYHTRMDRNLYDQEERVLGLREENRTGGFLRFGEQIARLGTVTGRIGREEVRTENPSDKKKKQYGLTTFTLESSVENFDRWPFPNFGKKSLFELQIAARVLGGDADYTRFYSSLESYFELLPGLVFHPRLAVGLSRSGLPSTEKFFSGGMNDLYGYRTDQLTGDKLVLLNSEMRLELPWRFFWAARYDVGELYDLTQQIKLRTLRHGIGTSLSWASPIGPLTLGYGVGENRRDRVYFSAGWQF